MYNLDMAKRRVVLLSFTKHINDFFMGGLATALKNAGNDVLPVYQIDESGVGGGGERCNWCSFDFRAIDAFKPDRLIIFNGMAKESSGATHYLKAKYKTFFVERGWLPQAHSIYIDQQGLGGRSSLATADLSDTKLLSKRVEVAVNTLRDSCYDTKGHPELGEYILVPMQLEHDTSIVLDSPYFKTMASLLAFVRKSFPTEKVIVTMHPKAPVPVALPSGFVNIPGLKTMDLAKTARAIIGINSTSMLESLLFRKPVGFLGKSVISGTSMVAYGPELTLQFPRNLLDRFKPDIQRVDAAIYTLMNKQFNRINVPENIVKQVEV